MNTFHTDTLIQQQKIRSEQLDLSYKRNEKGKVNCDNNIADQTATIQQLDEYVSQSIVGIAVKTSELKQFGINLGAILEVTSIQILIDAEYERLDYWLDAQLENNSISKKDLSRLIITIQVRRADASYQLTNLREYSKFGLKVVLVAGHSSYLKDVKTRDDVATQFSRFYNDTLVRKIGCGRRMARLLRENFDIDYQNSDIIELLGYHKISGSTLWCYYAGDQLSDQAEQYLIRRNSDKGDKFIIQSTGELQKLAYKHSLFLYVDLCCSDHYLSTIGNF